MNSNECKFAYNCLKFKNGNCSADEEFCIRQFKQDSLLSNALLSDKQKEHRELYLDNTMKDKDAYTILKNIENGVEKFVLSGKNLYIYSQITGNGKTEWSLRMLQSYVHKIWHKSDIGCVCLFINVPKYLIELKNNISKKSSYIEYIEENVHGADLVVFDDIGSKAGTEFEIEHLLSVINDRIDSGKSNIYTSNITPENLENVIGARLASRIIGMSTIVNFVENDKRGHSNI